MTIDLSKSLDDLLKDLEWDREKAVEIGFEDATALRANEFGHFSYRYIPRDEKSTAFERGMKLGKFLGTRYDAAQFTDEEIALRDNPLFYMMENAFVWGHKEDASKMVEIECYFASKGFIIIVRDQGDGFDVAEVVRKLDSGERYFVNGGTAFRVMKRDPTCTYSYNKKGNEAYILCLTANAQKAVR